MQIVYNKAKGASAILLRSDGRSSSAKRKRELLLQRRCSVDLPALDAPLRRMTFPGHWCETFQVLPNNLKKSRKTKLTPKDWISIISTLIIPVLLFLLDRFL